jgi:glycosyltransferase involved in cell wall biosynthesis
VSGRRVLLTVSGTIPAGIEEAVIEGRRPRVDYLEMAKAFNADLLDYAAVGASQGWIGRLIHRFAGANVAMALRCVAVRKEYDLVLTDGEQVGLPLAVLSSLLPMRGLPRHLMIVHILSVPKKAWLYRAMRLGRRIDEMIVYSSAQRDFITDRLAYPADQVALVPFMVDTQFFRADASGVQRSVADDRPVISSAGLEFRDYSTMLAAVAGIDARVVLAAASPWSKRNSGLEKATLAANVEVVRLDLHQLRELYAHSSLVVMPLRESDFQAGVTTLLEAMAMGMPIVCSRTTGQTDVIDDGVTGVYVPPGDAAALHTAIASLLADPERRRMLGNAARKWVTNTADIEVYVERLKDLVDRQLTLGRPT